MSEHTPFDPSRYLTKVGSSDYLEVKFRLLWLRSDHPDAHIDTELVAHADNWAAFKATISLKDGGSATGHGSEDINGFREYFEKAETKAIGRALAALGYGTQFCQDFDFAEGTGRVVDAPVGNQNGAKAAQTPRQESGKPSITNPDGPCSNPQLNYIRGLAKQLGWTVMGPDGEMHSDDGQIAAELIAEYGAEWPRITKGQASAIIEGLKEQAKKQAVR